MNSQKKRKRKTLLTFEYAKLVHCFVWFYRPRTHRLECSVRNEEKGGCSSGEKSLVSASHNSINIPTTGLNMLCVYYVFAWNRLILCRHIFIVRCPYAKQPDKKCVWSFFQCRCRSSLFIVVFVWVFIPFHTMNRVRAVVQVAHFNSMHFI